MLAGLQKKDEQALAACIRQYGAYAASVVRAAGPGQAAVFCRDDYVVGGGTII